MKLKHIFGIALAAVAIVGCSDDDTIGSLSQVTLSSSYLDIDAAGGSTTLTINANSDWKFNNVYSVITDNKTTGKKDTTWYPTPTWLTVSQSSGTSGSSTITFTAAATEAGREADMQITVGGETQYLKLRQGSLEATTATAAEINKANDGKTFRVTGAVSGIQSLDYGNYYIVDATGSIYVYGTLDKDGKEKNFKSLGIEEGDVITVEGPKSTYGGQAQLVKVTVLKITKALIKLESGSFNPISSVAGDYVVKVSYKGSGAYPAISSGAESWVRVGKTEFKAGVPTKTEANPADTAYVTLHLSDNSAGVLRKGSVVFTSANGSNSSSVTVSLEQDGLIKAASVADFLAASVDKYQQYRLTGTISKVDDNAKGFYITDGTGDVFVYKATGFSSKKYKVGDAITLVGMRGVHDGKAQMVTARVE